MINACVQSGSKFTLAFTNLVDSNGAVVNTEAHLHITKPGGTVDILTTADGDIDYASPSTDPETGVAVLNKYETSAVYSVVGKYRYQWHFPTIEFADSEHWIQVIGPVIVEPTP